MGDKLDGSKEAKKITAFQGRLLVFSPKHRFQVLIGWHADLHQGYARLTHAASGRVMELHWQGEHLRMRDNQVSTSQWRTVDEKQWQEMGIVLPPWSLAKILHHQMPQSLHSNDGKLWKGKINGSVIQVQWKQNNHLLTIMDITHGRKAILRMNP
ncbi:MAG: hypothetical protein Q9M18_06945 [Mariprofundaceae bacterium]|nr:hypothetical protein [Mariprofundaceae bacterium]